VLDGFKPDGDAKFGLKVVISDPSAKIKRSDAQDSVIFVGGLNAKSTEAEVKDLFKGVSHALLTLSYADLIARANPVHQNGLGLGQKHMQGLRVRHYGVRGIVICPTAPTSAEFFRTTRKRRLSCTELLTRGDC
jgi:RNA recognition motif-containing protein